MSSLSAGGAVDGRAVVGPALAALAPRSGPVAGFGPPLHAARTKAASAARANLECRIIAEQ
jgi:hypothetical protein